MVSTLHYHYPRPHLHHDLARAMSHHSPTVATYASSSESLHCLDLDVRPESVPPPLRVAPDPLPSNSTPSALSVPLPPFAHRYETVTPFTPCTTTSAPMSLCHAAPQLRVHHNVEADPPVTAQGRAVNTPQVCIDTHRDRPVHSNPASSSLSRHFVSMTATRPHLTTVLQQQNHHQHGHPIFQPCPEPHTGHKSHKASESFANAQPLSSSSSSLSSLTHSSSVTTNANTTQTHQGGGSIADGSVRRQDVIAENNLTIVNHSQHSHSHSHSHSHTHFHSHTHSHSHQAQVVDHRISFNTVMDTNVNAPSQIARCNHNNNHNDLVDSQAMDATVGGDRGTEGGCISKGLSSMGMAHGPCATIQPRTTAEIAAETSFHYRRLVQSHDYGRGVTRATHAPSASAGDAEGGNPEGHPHEGMPHHHIAIVLGLSPSFVSSASPVQHQTQDYQSNVNECTTKDSTPSCVMDDIVRSRGRSTTPTSLRRFDMRTRTQSGRHMTDMVPIATTEQEQEQEQNIESSNSRKRTDTHGSMGMRRNKVEPFLDVMRSVHAQVQGPITRARSMHLRKQWAPEQPRQDGNVNRNEDTSGFGMGIGSTTDPVTSRNTVTAYDCTSAPASAPAPLPHRSHRRIAQQMHYGSVTNRGKSKSRDDDNRRVAATDRTATAASVERNRDRDRDRDRDSEKEQEGLPRLSPAYKDLVKLATLAGNVQPSDGSNPPLVRIGTEYVTPPQFGVSYARETLSNARRMAVENVSHVASGPALVSGSRSASRSESPPSTSGGVTHGGEGIPWASPSPSPSPSASPCWSRSRSSLSSSDVSDSASESESETDDDSDVERTKGNGTKTGRRRGGSRLRVKLSPMERRERLIHSLTRVLETTCNENNKRLRVGAVALRTGYRSTNYPDGSNSLFFSLCKPAIGIRAYVARFIKYLPVSEAVFIVGLVYLDRVRKREAVLGLTHLNVHRLLTCAITIAQKFLEDEPYGNSTMFKLGGIPSVAELNQLEIEFLKRIDCRVHIEPELYEEYRRMVVRT